jgi:hypothetical protein
LCLCSGEDNRKCKKYLWTELRDLQCWILPKWNQLLRKCQSSPVQKWQPNRAWLSRCCPRSWGEHIHWLSQGVSTGLNSELISLKLGKHFWGWETRKPKKATEVEYQIFQFSRYQARTPESFNRIPDFWQRMTSGRI